MSERTEKAEQIFKVGFNDDYAKAVLEIVNLYGDALMEIVESEVSSAEGAELKMIAQNAVVKGFQISQSVMAKIKQN